MKKIKRITAVLLALLCFVPTAFAANPKPVTIYVNNVLVAEKGMIQNGRTLVPLRAVTEAMGAEIEWIPETREIQIWRTIPICTDAGDGHLPIVGQTHYEILFKIGSFQVLYTNPVVTDATDSIDVAAQIYNGKTMVPLRAACEYLGGTVGWDPETKTAYVEYSEMMMAEQTGDTKLDAAIAERDAIGAITDMPISGDYSILITPTGCTTPVDIQVWVGDAYGMPTNLNFVRKSSYNKTAFFTRTGYLTGIPGESIYDVPDYPENFTAKDQTGTFSGIRMMSLEGNLWLCKEDLQQLGLMD